MFSGDVEDGKDEQHDDSIEDNLSNSGVINLIFFYWNQAVDPNQSRKYKCSVPYYLCIFQIFQYFLN